MSPLAYLYDAERCVPLAKYPEPVQIPGHFEVWLQSQWRKLLFYICSLILFSITVHFIQTGETQVALDAARGITLPAVGDQHIWIVRHGDKFDSYPKCPAEPLCFNATLQGNNPSLTPCGLKQAEHVARWLQSASELVGGIQNIVVSPFTRTLQTSLPLAKALGLKLKVEHLLSEADRMDGPFREYNALQRSEVWSQLQDAHALWDLDYGSPPIPTPETVSMYGQRVQKAAETLRKRFPPAVGNLAVVTHATPSFSIAYGLCHGDGPAEALEEFVDRQDAIGPCGVIHVVLDRSGRCKAIDQTVNDADSLGCGLTPAYKCQFNDYPAWYWPNPGAARNPSKC